MSHSEEALTPTRAVASRVRELRKENGFSSAAQLAERMTSLGFQWDRFTVQNLENGRRQNVTVDELLALAYVLNVAPVHLLVPPVDGDDEEPRIAVIPTMPAPPGAVRDWIRGEMPFGEVDPRRYFSQVPPDEFGRGPYGGGPAGAIVG